MGVINDIIGVRLPITPQVCMLELAKRTKKTKQYLKFADLAMVIFKRQIARAWKALLPPLQRDWIREVHKWAKVEADALRQISKQKGDNTLMNVWDTYVIRLNEKVNPLTAPPLGTET